MSLYQRVVSLASSNPKALEIGKAMTASIAIMSQRRLDTIDTIVRECSMIPTVLANIIVSYCIWRE